MILSSDAARSTFRTALREHLTWLNGPATPKRVTLERILNTIDAPAFPGAIIPAIRKTDMRFYAVADTPTSWRKLQPLLSATVGMTLTDFTGTIRADLTSEGIEGLLQQAELIVASFEAPPENPNWNQAAVDALVRLVRQVEAAPDIVREQPLSTVELLHNFDLAVSAGNEDGARAVLQELEHRQLLEILNLRFLQVRLDATFQHWQRLRERAWFYNLARTRRPVHVTAALIEALYHVGLAEQRDTLQEADLEAIRRQVLPHAGDLLQHPLRTRTPAVATLYLWYAVAEQDHALRQFVEHDPTDGWPERERMRFQSLLTLDSSPPPPTPTAPVDRDTEAYLTELADASELDVDAALAALVATRGDGSLAIERLQQRIRERLNSNPGTPNIEAIEVEGTEAPIPSNWVEWFGGLAGAPYEVMNDIATRAVEEWPLHEHLRNPADIEAFTDAVNLALSGPHATRASNAFPHLLQWLRGDSPLPNPDYTDLYRQLFDALLVADTRNSDSFASVLELADWLLQLGVNTGTYRTIADDIRSALPAIASSRTVDHLVDAGELLTLHPCPDEAARVALWAEALRLVNQYAPRLELRHRAIINDLCLTLGTPEGFRETQSAGPEDTGNDAHATWSGLIGIYSLRRETAIRAQGTLRSLFPAARVELNGDEVATERLRNLASTADVMIVTWSAAKHAATAAIGQARRATPTWASGGSSTLVTRVTDEIDRLLTRAP